MVGSGGFTAEKIARAARSGLASILGIGLGGRPRGRVVMGLVVIAPFSIMAIIMLRQEVWLGNSPYFLADAASMMA